MTLIRYFDFGGLDRATEPHLVEPDRAINAVDLDVTKRSLRGLPAFVQRSVLTHSYEPPGAQVALPLSSASGTLTWLVFPFWVSLVETPAINDSWGRIYWSRDGDGAGGLYYHRQSIFNYSAAWKLGVPRPTTAPTVAVSGGTGPTTDRAYVYCYRTSLGELGPPSPPRLATGNTNGTWQISGLPSAPTAECAPLSAIEIYRTSVGNAGVSYRFVASVNIGTTSYDDTLSDSELALRLPLLSTWWDPPPVGLKNLLRHPSGALVAFVGNTVCFSEPWHPHGWPIPYSYTVPHAIRALALVRDALVVFTTGRVYYLVGTHPSSMALIEGDAAFDVPSPRAVANLADGAVVATDSGLLVLTENEAGNISEELFTPEEWRSYYNSATQVGATGREIVVNFGNSRGLLIYRRQRQQYVASFLSLYNINHIVSPKAADKIWYQSSVAPGRIDLYTVDDYANTRRPWSWSSPSVRLPQPENLGVVHIRGSLVTSGQPAVSGDEYDDYNAARWAAGPLDVLDGYSLGGESYVTYPLSVGTLVPPLQPLGGEPLWLTTGGSGAALGGSASALDHLRVRVWADDVLRFDEGVQLDTLRRLPSGFKATSWRMEVDGGPRVEVNYAALASTIEAAKRG